MPSTPASCTQQLNDFYSNKEVQLSIGLTARLIKGIANYFPLPKLLSEGLVSIASLLEKWLEDARAGQMTMQHVAYLCYLFSLVRLILQDYPEVWMMYVELMPHQLQVFTLTCCEGG